MLVAVVSAIAGVLVAAMLAFFAWLAISIMNLRAGQLALETSIEEGRKSIVSELRGEFAVALARMETRLMAAICGRDPPRPRNPLATNATIDWRRARGAFANAPAVRNESGKRPGGLGTLFPASRNGPRSHIGAGAVRMIETRKR